MDTSNNQTNETLTAPLTVAQYLLGDVTSHVATSSLPPAEWARILRLLIRKCRPYMKYLALREIGFVLDQEWTKSGIYSEKLGRTVSYPEGFDAKTRVLHFPSSPAPIRGKDRRTWYKMLLAENGTILLFTYHSACTRAAYEPHREEWRREKQTKFTVFTDDDLATLIEQWPRTIPDVLESLIDVLQEGIRKREQVIKELEQVKNTLRRAKNLIFVH